MRSFAEILERRAETERSCEKSEPCEKGPRPEFASVGGSSRRGENVRAAPSPARRELIASRCGRPDCAGCYEVEPGRHIHPPKSSHDWLEWLARWQKPKGEPFQ